MTQHLANFLAHLHRGGTAGYYWTVSSAGTKRTHWWNGTGRTEPPASAVNLYFGVNPTTTIPTANAKGEPREPHYLRARIDLIAAINCVFAEFDAKDYSDDLGATLAAVERLQPRPSVVVASGGGYHCYWLLDEPWLLQSDAERQQARQLLWAWVDYTGGDTAAKDLARVLRLPGSLNYKYNPPRPVAFVWCELDRLYQRGGLAERVKAVWAEGKLDRAIEKVKRAPDGLKHRELLKAARLAGGVADILGEQRIAADLYDAIELRADDPANAAQTIQDGIGYGKAAPLHFEGDKYTHHLLDAVPLSRGFILECLSEGEAGDAKLTEATYAGQLVYDHDAGTWYTFEGHAWTRYSGTPHRAIWGRVAAIYLALAAQIQSAAGADKESVLKTVDALTKRAAQLRSLNRINNVLTLARGLLGVNGSVWDADPWLLGVTNGVIDLRTGHLRDGQPEDYIRTVAPTAWKSIDAPAPRWERFVSEVLSDEADRVAFLQRLLGYALNGATSEHVLSICVGERGRNGKRVLFEAIQHVLGDYARSVSTDVLIGQEHKRAAGSAQPHLMELQGKRIAYCSETGEYDKLSTAQVKNITGGDPVTARRLNENLVTFMPTHTLFLQTNRKPQAPADDDALWERVKVIEFKVRFVEHPTAPDERPRDPKLESTLQAEAAGILAWLVRGGLDWQRGGLQTPASVRLARDTYRKGESIEPFLSDCCTEWDGGSAEGGALNEAYKAWCELRGLRPKSAVWLGKQLVQLFEKGRVTTAGPNAGRTVYHGVTLRDRKDWTLENVADSPTTLQSLQYPSIPIETPKSNDLNSEIEGLECPSDSMGQNTTREGVSLNNPSIPSIPSIDPEEQVLPQGYRVEQSGPRWQLRTPSGAVSWHSSQEQAIARAIELGRPAVLNL